MMAAAGAPGTGQIGLALADAGYLSQANLTCPGPDRLIATGKRRNLEKAARAADTAGPEPAGAARSRRPPPRWPPASPPKTGSPPTAGAATSARPSTATSSTTWASAA